MEDDAEGSELLFCHNICFFPTFWDYLAWERVRFWVMVIGVGLFSILIPSTITYYIVSAKTQKVETKSTEQQLARQSQCSDALSLQTLQLV